MILVLSCFGLASVIISHPLLISLTVFWPLQIYPVGGFSLFALLMLTIERFLGVMFPIFHRTSITKKRLLYILASLNAALVALLPLHYFYWNMTGEMLTTAFLLLFFLAFVYLLYIVKFSSLPSQKVK